MQATEFVQSYFDAWNHRDPVAVAEHLARNGQYCDVADNTFQSQAELVVSLQDYFSSYCHRYELIGDILVGSDTIAFQYRMCPIVQDGKRSSYTAMRGAEFITLHRDAAMTIYDYYDIPDSDRSFGAAPILRDPSPTLKYAKSGLSVEQMTEYKERLDFIMRSQQAYLQPGLTLPKLARQLDCSVNHLSQVINAGFGTSFFDYLNRFRVEHAKDLFSKLEGRCGAVLSIAFTVGFNSNSAFYAAFKKHVGQTPAEYRRAIVNDDH